MAELGRDDGLAMVDWAAWERIEKEKKGKGVWVVGKMTSGPRMGKGTRSTQIRFKTNLKTRNFFLFFPESF
jgi:hypothetical protein